MKAYWVIALVAVAGCSSGKPTTRPSTVSQRADQALRDPFNYKPGSDFPDVSGGGLTDLDKDGLKRDLDHVFNP